MSQPDEPIEEPAPGQSSPVAEELSPVPGGVKRAFGMAGKGLGCLILLVVSAIVLFAALAIVLDNPTFWIAVVALLVAAAAYRASKRAK